MWQAITAIIMTYNLKNSINLTYSYGGPVKIRNLNPNPQVVLL